MVQAKRRSVANEKILVVDDGKDNRDFVVEHVLKPNGFVPLTAKDGVECLQIVSRERPDLILLDLQMPRMDGLQVLQRLNEHNVNIPVILMTFHGSEEIAIEVFRMGVRDYIKKPYYPGEMLDAIERSLTEIRLRRERDALTERVMQANKELQRRFSQIHVLHQVGRHVTSIINLDELLPFIVESAVYITHAEESQLLLIEDQKLVRRAYKDLRSPRAQSVKAESRDPVAVHAIRSRQTVVLNDSQAQKYDPKLQSVAYTPLRLEKRILGVLGIKNYTNNAPPIRPEENATLELLADYASIAIENSRNYQELLNSKEQLRDTFERFVPPSVVKETLARSSIQLGGQRQEISVLFADIRGYTAWSENAEPERVLETLNHYLSLAAGVIISWEGTLDKYFGDGLMAIFNAPDSQADHVHRCADAALAIQRAAQEVTNIHGHQLTYSVGVNVGEAVVGYMGTERAMNYTAIGDTVNLAKRLQEYAAPGQILVDEEVVKRLGNRVKARPLGELRVKGRKTPAYAYELVDLT